MLPSLHRAAPMRIDPAIWPVTAMVDDDGRLCVGGVPLTDIADEFGTPAYVIDEADFRLRARRYRTALRDVEIVYAGQGAADHRGGPLGRRGGARARRLLGRRAGRRRSPAGLTRAASSCTATPSRHDEFRDAAAAAASDASCWIAAPRSRCWPASCTTAQTGAHPGHPGHRHPRACARSPPGSPTRSSASPLDGGHAPTAVGGCSASPSCDLVGLHCHLGSQVTDAAPYGEAIHRMIAADGRHPRPARRRPDRS